MSNISENRICQNCKGSFTIEPNDFSFYEKIKVPPPTFCPECRMLRKLTWRNERSLYKRKCDLCEKSIISIYDDSVIFPVYCHNCWYSDEWDPLDYGQDYNFSKSFIDQFKELSLNIPVCSLFNINQVNSEYCNFTYQSKNCYLNFASDMNEDTGYLYHSIYNRNCYDMLGSRKNENSYQLIDCEECYGSNNLNLCNGCVDSRYCYDCNNCTDIIGCCGLRNAKFRIFNIQYTQEEYKKELSKMKLSSQVGNLKILNEFNNLFKKQIRKYCSSKHIVDCTGDYIKGAKDCKICFDIEGPAKELKYCIYGVTKIENIYDGYAFGLNIENCYEALGFGDSVQNVFFSMYTFSGSFNCRYSIFSNSSNNLFGCISIKKGQYVILNKQYTKEEYEELVPKIIKHMNDMPYIDSKGRVYKYGEFFPSELSPFAYNETIAQEYFPLTKEQALEQGYKWKDKEERNYNIDIKTEDIPDDINDVNDDITSKIIECAHKGTCNQQCTEAFKIIPEELTFYRRMNLPLPRLCPNCRHGERILERNPMKLWHRTCMKEGCTNEFETSYAPDRPEIIYCERCYQQEVY